MSLSYVVLTLNEESEIAGCLDSLGPAEEVLLVDGGSTDATVERARAAAVGKPFLLRIAIHDFHDFAEQRNVALGLARTEWVFFVDADERSSPDQAVEIGECLAGAEPPAGFWVPRVNYILGHRMRYTGWWPDYQLRLFQRRRGRYDPSRPVHELVELDGPAGHLRTPLIHYNYRRLGQFFDKQRRYARQEAAQRRHAGERVRPRGLVTLPVREFVWRYVTLRGWRDGGHGLLLSLLMAWYRLLVAGRMVS